jgi:hypothetical protein
MKGWISYILFLQLANKILPIPDTPWSVHGAYIVSTAPSTQSATAFPENQKRRRDVRTRPKAAQILSVNFQIDLHLVEICLVIS